jgi:hypothetical protein
MSFYLGGPIDPNGDRIAGETTQYDASDLTTHAVIVGMTGSGKTGLGIIYLEEALRSGVPCLIIDPKGDMTNLLLTFPDLAPSDFEPWVDISRAKREGRTSSEDAADEAAKWEKGLGWWNLSGADIGDLKSRVGMTIYTPGSSAGVPVNVVGGLEPPDLSWEDDAEAMRDEIQGFTSGLLGLVDIDADPISSREHILIANLIEYAWRAGTALDIGALISQIVTPPIRTLGVFDVDEFFPEKARTALAMRLNGLLASPSFADWMTGDDLDIESLLWKGGEPQAAVMYLAHLSDAERQFVVTMIFSKLITWMRSQPGSSDLRVLAYMDEVYGFVPPTAQPPAKRPILTLLKQARAFGVGLILSTQNPVDLDYKAMSNAGTWCIGRLQTERDKARIVEALNTASGGVDAANLDDRISGLAKRSFLLHSTRNAEPELFTTRWAMSYLRGPMTRDEVGRFRPEAPKQSAEDLETTNHRPQTTEQNPASAPDLPSGVDSFAVHPAAPWRSTVGDDSAGTAYRAAIAVTVEMTFDEARIGVEHTEAWEAVMVNLDSAIDVASAIEVDHDARDFVAPDPSIPYIPTDAPLSQASYFKKVASEVKKYLDRNETLELMRNRPLGLVSRPDETKDAFEKRCLTEASSRKNSDKTTVARKFESKLRTARRGYDKAVDDADLASQAIEDRRNEDIFSFGFDLLTGRKPRRRSKGTRERDRLRRAETKIDTKRIAYEDLNDDLEDAIDHIDAEWDAKALEIEDVTIGLEADDIKVAEVRLIWIRVREPNDDGT